MHVFIFGAHGVFLHSVYMNNKGENMNKKKWLIIGILLVLGCIIAIYAYPILRTKILEPKVMELVSKNNTYTNFSYIQKATEENEQDLYIKSYIVFHYLFRSS